MRTGLGVEVDRAVEELLQQETEHVGIDERGDLVSEPELAEDLLDVGREAVEVRLEVGSKLLLLGLVCEVAEAKGRRVVEGLAGHPAQRSVLADYSHVVQVVFHPQDRILRGLQDGIEAADDRHGQDDVAVLAAHVDVAQNVICDAPYEAAYVQGAVTNLLQVTGLGTIAGAFRSSYC